MTYREIFIKEFGEEEYSRISPRLKRVFEKLDAITANERPLSRKQLADSLR